MKESFGFIERADVVKEIFFHFSEAKTKEELRLGDDVEYIIQTRNVSRTNCNIRELVVFDVFQIMTFCFIFRLHQLLFRYRII